MHTNYKCQLPKGFAHTHSLSQLANLQGTAQINDLSVTFADSNYKNQGNYLHQLEKTDGAYLVVQARFSIYIVNPDRPNPYTVYIFPVRVRELKVIRASIDPLISKLVMWISTPRPATWSLHRHKMEIWFDPATEALSLVEKSSPPSDLRS
jgi:hypothetical protein